MTVAAGPQTPGSDSFPATDVYDVVRGWLAACAVDGAVQFHLDPVQANLVTGMYDEKFTRLVADSNSRMYERIPALAEIVATTACPVCDAQPSQDCRIMPGHPGVHGHRITAYNAAARTS